MQRGSPTESGLDQRKELFRGALGFEGLSGQEITALAQPAFYRSFDKGQTIFDQGEACQFYLVVAEGLVKVFICSSSGVRMTYLLAARGEPLNLIGPFTGTPRYLAAQALRDSVVAHVPREDFVRQAMTSPVLLVNIMSILGKAIDSANSRLVDMMEKRVEERLIRVLLTLMDKFGTQIKLTSSELADLAGTTIESTLRTMARLRSLGIVESERGQVHIVKPAALKKLKIETLWF